MTKVPGDQMVTNFELVAKEMNCSQGLLHSWDRLVTLEKNSSKKIL